MCQCMSSNGASTGARARHRTRAAARTGNRDVAHGIHARDALAIWWEVCLSRLCDAETNKRFVLVRCVIPVRFRPCIALCVCVANIPALRVCTARHVPVNASACRVRALAVAQMHPPRRRASSRLRLSNGRHSPRRSPTQTPTSHQTSRPGRPRTQKTTRRCRRRRTRRARVRKVSW